MVLEQVEISTATPADLAETDALFARSYPVLLKPDYPPSVLVTALPIISRAQPQLLASRTFYLARLEGQIVGAGGWTQAAPGGAEAGNGVGHIRHVVTDAAHTRLGIGRALMTHIIDTARASGIAELRCQSTRTAVPFYAALGFVVGPEVDVPLRSGIVFPAVSMVRAL